jgi:hypothetical protein
MTRITLGTLLFALVSPVMVAQAQQDIPIQRDLKRTDRLDQGSGATTQSSRSIRTSRRTTQMASSALTDLPSTTVILV